MIQSANISRVERKTKMMISLILLNLKRVWESYTKMTIAKSC
jgi:hypothetical protein